MLIGTTLGKEKLDGTVYYINIPSKTLDDVFEQGLFHGWTHMGEYTVCNRDDYFSLERFEMDKMYWRVLFCLNGNTQIRENETVLRLPKNVPYRSPSEQPLEAIHIPPAIELEPVIELVAEPVAEPVVEPVVKDPFMTSRVCCSIC